MPGPYGDFTKNNSFTDYNSGQQGVFADYPLATPKYAKNKGNRNAEFRDTLARIYISLADAGKALQDAYIASLPVGGSTEALARVLIGANSKGGTGFIDFFLTSVNETHQEIMQVDKVLADDYVAFFYGQNPPQFQYSGMLLNSMQDDQRSGFARAYQVMLRGTQLARRGALARLRYDSVIVSGVMIATSQQLAAENEMVVPFSFTFLVKEYVILDNPLFTKLDKSQYVQIAADLNAASVSPVGAINDTRVYATAVTAPIPAAVSTAGAAAPTTVVDTNVNPMVQQVSMSDALPPNLSEDLGILGTVDPTPPTPPAAP